MRQYYTLRDLEQLAARLISALPGALFTTERRGVLRQKVGLRELALNTGHCKLQAVSFFTLDVNVKFIKISCLVFILFHIFSVTVYLLSKSQVVMNPNSTHVIRIILITKT
jgi:hypothetical protein